MNYAELKTKIDTFTPEQLQQNVVVFIGDEEHGNVIESMDISDEDFYWDGTDLCGNLERAKESYGDDWEEEKDNLTIVPKGTVSLQC